VRTRCDHLGGNGQAAPEPETAPRSPLKVAYFPAPRWLAVVFCAVAGYGVFATFARNVELAAPGWEHLAYLAGVVGVFAMASGLYALRGSLERLSRRVTAFAERTNGVCWLSGCLVAGATTRFIWNLWYPPVQRSDMATYVALARSVLRDGEYVTAGSYAYWPPGLPFSLVPTLALLSDHPWVPMLNNLVWFGLALAAAYWLGVLLVDRNLAKIATLLATLWPNLALLSGLAAKELVLVALLPLALGAYVRATITAGGGATKWGLLAGVTLGYAALTQPSLLLLPVVFVVYELMRRERWARSSGRVVALLVGMVLVVAPWTIRNYRVLDAFVLVNTAGGNSLYQANNPAATGGYVPGLADDLDQYDELTAARVARQRALKWISENPGRVISLALRKQILLLGDDSSGAYGTLKRGLEVGGVEYGVFKGISNAYWIFILSLVPLAVLRLWSGVLLDRPEIALLMLPLLYALVIHSVFESDGRHHVAAAVPLALIGGLAFGQAGRGSAAARRDARPE
jgi:4-amino-4-deoxy-L-arabinose transferase-like glycosyltransferase